MTVKILFFYNSPKGVTSWSSFDWNHPLILIYLSDMIIQDGPDPSQMILFPIIVDFPMFCSYGIAGTLGWILSSRIKPFNGMDFRYSRTQRSRDIKLYLILWFIWSCIWWCWFLKISQRQGIPTFLSTNVQRYQTPFNFLIYLMYLMFHFMILVLVYIARYLTIFIPEKIFHQQHGFLHTNLARNQTLTSFLILVIKAPYMQIKMYIIRKLRELGTFCIYCGISGQARKDL